MPTPDPLQIEFGTLADLVRLHATEAPERPALIEGHRTLTYGELDTQMNRVASALQHDGLKPGDAITLCATMSIAYAVVFLGALRAGVVVAPLAPGSTADGLARMMVDAQAKLVFVDAASSAQMEPMDAGGVSDVGSQARQIARTLVRVAMDESSAAGVPLGQWLSGAGDQPVPVAVEPHWAFNIIYSSGTTGEPKGIVQSHGMRWTHVRRGGAYGYGPGTVTMLSTPLYSNTTLVVFLPTLAFGGTAVLMPKFDAAGYLQLAQTHKATHTMLVPVQYQRLMARPDFDAFDLSSFRYKFSTSAPFGAALKADVLKRWPGGLIEFYGMTEGGGTCILEAHLNPTKLHTVGRPAEGHDIRLVNDQGEVQPLGEAGEVVGHSPGMMTGYHGQPDKTREAEWFDATGKRFIRTGDIGRFDSDGFLTLFDRKKDMIISGGFNVYPSDLEAVLREHPSVLETAVVGVPSTQWGETPVAFAVLRQGQAASVEALMAWVNQRVGKTQRVAALHLLDELPRSAIGKVLKRELRARYMP